RPASRSGAARGARSNGRDAPGRRPGGAATRRRRARGAVARGVLHDGARRRMTMLTGLADPTLDSQRIFRSILEAMANPGRIVDVAVELQAPPPLPPAAPAPSPT